MSGIQTDDSKHYMEIEEPEKNSQSLLILCHLRLILWLANVFWWGNIAKIRKYKT
jgi:hypothetical protein